MVNFLGMFLKIKLLSSLMEEGGLYLGVQFPVTTVRGIKLFPAEHQPDDFSDNYVKLGTMRALEVVGDIEILVNAIPWFKDVNWAEERALKSVAKQAKKFGADTTIIDFVGYGLETNIFGNPNPTCSVNASFYRKHSE